MKSSLVALVLVLGIAGHAAPVNADAMADQKAAFKKMGIKFEKKANKCTFFRQADAERALHGPVVFLPNEVDPTICAWGLARDSSIGVNVSREPRSSWYPPKPGDAATSQVRHVAGVGENAYTAYMNAGPGGVYSAVVLTPKGVTDVELTEKAGNAATALAIARSVMNR